jgi:hypothetical protein
MATKTQREDEVKTTATYRRRIVKRVVLGLAIAAVAAPIAQAQTPIPSDLANRQFWAVQVVPDELSGRQFGPTTAGQNSTREPGTIPAQLDGRQYGPSSLPLVTIPNDLSSREYGPATFTTDIPVSTPVVDGFDWRDAGVGAAIAVAVALLGAAALLLGRKRTLAGA